jgi:hypothetical protein
VPRIGVTGHASLTGHTAELVAAELREVLAGWVPLVGVTCLARGADQVFAEVVLELGGSVEVVLPAVDYRDRKVEPSNLAAFDALVARAATVHTMPYAVSGREAYLAASEHVLGQVEHVVAVWDGSPADGGGGTGDVVHLARERGLPLTVVWPSGAKRG